jgi:hypothetical protein
VSSRVAASAALLAGVLASAAVARGQDDPGRAAFDQGAALASERKYDEAARAFERSYELDAKKEALFAWAQVERLAGHCRKAADLYQRFLASPDLTPTQIEAAELNRHRCEEEPPPRPAPVLTAPPPVVTPVPARSRQAMVLGTVLAGGAAAATAGSFTFFLIARNDERQASSAELYGDYFAPARRARDRQRLALGLLGAGVLLGGGALLDWLVTAPRATAWLDGTSAGLALAGRY